MNGRHGSRGRFAPAPSVALSFDADAIAALVNAFGIPAVVEQTGGGCATLYAGSFVPDDNGDGRYHVACGPGTYGWGERPSVFDDGELYVGPDDNGLTMPTDALLVGCRDDRDVADLIIAHVKHAPRGSVLDADTLESMGFDSTLRGRPRIKEGNRHGR